MANLNYDIRAMLRKFGVVTVMDVRAYKTELFSADTKDKTAGVDYIKGEWDAVSTFYEEKDENSCGKTGSG